MPYGLDNEDIEKLLNILFSNKKVESVILFGSRAKGNEKSGSDIDLALKGAGLDLNDIIDLKVLIDQTSVPYMVDLIIYEKIAEPMLKEHIDRVGIDIYPT
jgi:predicted nucleotidyltransferase